MTTYTINVKDGMGREKFVLENPNRFISHKKYITESNKWDEIHAELPSFQPDGITPLSDGVYEVVLQHQYEPQDEDYYEWRNCSESLYNSLKKINSSYPGIIKIQIRQIYIAIAPEKKEEQKVENVYRGKNETPEGYKDWLNSICKTEKFKYYMAIVEKQEPSCYADIALLLYEHAGDRWISVSEGLPKKGN